MKAFLNVISRVIFCNSWILIMQNILLLFNIFFMLQFQSLAKGFDQVAN